MTPTRRRLVPRYLLHRPSFCEFLAHKIARKIHNNLNLLNIENWHTACIYQGALSPGRRCSPVGGLHMTSLALSRRHLLTAGLAAPFVLRSGVALSAPETLKFALAAPFVGSNAAFFLAEKQGCIQGGWAELPVRCIRRTGAAASQVGSGVYDLGVADINVMAELTPRTRRRRPQLLYAVLSQPIERWIIEKVRHSVAGESERPRDRAAAPDGAYRLFRPSPRRRAWMWRISSGTWLACNCAKPCSPAAMWMPSSASDSTMFFGLEGGHSAADGHSLHILMRLWGSISMATASCGKESCEPRSGCGQAFRRSDGSRLAGGDRRSQRCHRRPQGARPAH